MSTAGLLALGACGVSEEDRIDRLNPEGWPDSLVVVGEGYPNSGDPCRQLGSSAAVSSFEGELIDLVGCPTSRDANELTDARIVGEVEGYTILALDREPPDGEGDEPETPAGPMPEVAYGNIGSVYCEGRGYGGSTRCQAGVRAEPGPGGSVMVDILFPNGNRRSLIFEDGVLVSADSSEADGSAAWDLTVRRQNGRQYVSHGPERFILLDNFLGIQTSSVPAPLADPLAPLAAPEPPPPPTQGD